MSRLFVIKPTERELEQRVAMLELAIQVALIAWRNSPIKGRDCLLSDYMGDLASALAESKTQATVV